MNRILVLAALIIYGLSAQAIPHKASVKKQDKYLDTGVIVGGRAGKGFSLLNVRRDIAKNQSLERIIMDIGDEEGRPQRGRAAYFHANLETKPPRLVLDLHQMLSTSVDEAKLRAIFQNSPFISI